MGCAQWPSVCNRRVESPGHDDSSAMFHGQRIECKKDFFSGAFFAIHGRSLSNPAENATPAGSCTTLSTDFVDNLQFPFRSVTCSVFMPDAATMRRNFASCSARGMRQRHRSAVCRGPVSGIETGVAVPAACIAAGTTGNTFCQGASQHLCTARVETAVLPRFSARPRIRACVPQASH